MENMMASFITKERSVNFSKGDMERLQTLLTKHQYFVKKTDGVSSKQKESAWAVIELEFNAGAKTPRTIKQLKYKFENLKRAAKRGGSKERQEVRRTGGGPPPPPEPGIEDTMDWLRSIARLMEILKDDDSLSHNGKRHQLE